MIKNFDTWLNEHYEDQLNGEYRTYSHHGDQDGCVSVNHLQKLEWFYHRASEGMKTLAWFIHTSCSKDAKLTEMFFKQLKLQEACVNMLSFGISLADFKWDYNDSKTYKNEHKIGQYLDLLFIVEKFIAEPGNSLYANEVNKRSYGETMSHLQEFQDSYKWVFVEYVNDALEKVEEGTNPDDEQFRKTLRENFTKIDEFMKQFVKVEDWNKWFSEISHAKRGKVHSLSFGI